LQRSRKEVRTGIEEAREALRYGGTEQINYYLPYFYGMVALSQMEGRAEHAKVVVEFSGQIINRPTLKPDEKANLLYQRAAAELFLQQFDAAAKDYDIAATLVPTHVGARLGLADVYVRQGKADKAEAAFTAAVQAVPNNPLVYNNRGMFLQNQGKTQPAIADFTRAIELDPNYTVAYTNRGFAAMAESNPQAAEADFGAALRIDPQQPLVHSLRGTARLSQGNPQAAIEDYSQVLKMDPKNPIAHADLGFAKYFAGDFAGAGAAFDQAVTMDANLRYLNPWRYWSQMKANQAAAAATKLGDSLTKAADKRDWVDQLGAYLAGSINDDTLLAAVDKAEGPLRTAQLCEAFFFQAEKKAAAGDTAGAAALYQQTLDTKQAQLSAYRGAQYALKKFPPAK
jgi:lipoprotein NlpI